MDKQIFQAALDKWGLLGQVAMTHGEMGELATALTQYFVQNKVGPEAVVDELADVRIMVGQMTMLIEKEDGCETGAVDKRYQEKLQRLAGLVGLLYCNSIIGDQDKSFINVRDYQKDVKVNIHIETPESKQLKIAEDIVEKWPHAMPLLEFMDNEQVLKAGTVLVNHVDVTPMTVTQEMLDNENCQFLNWYNMRHWFVIDSPQWQREEKETQLNLLFRDINVRARDGGREIASRLYDLGYRAPNQENEDDQD